jgi:cytochrome c5
MKQKQTTVWWRASVLAGASLMILGLTLVQAQPTVKKGETKKAGPKKTEPELTGEELYQINCNRCHSERYPTEFTSAQWQTIMLEMRVRANLPAEQAGKILQYLQQDSGN